jgi:hypothetical protein
MLVRKETEALLAAAATGDGMDCDNWSLPLWRAAGRSGYRRRPLLLNVGRPLLLNVLPWVLTVAAMTMLLATRLHNDGAAGPALPQTLVGGRLAMIRTPRPGRDPRWAAAAIAAPSAEHENEQQQQSPTPQKLQPLPPCGEPRYGFELEYAARRGGPLEVCANEYGRTTPCPDYDWHKYEHVAAIVQRALGETAAGAATRHERVEDNDDDDAEGDADEDDDDEGHEDEDEDDDDETIKTVAFRHDAGTWSVTVRPYCCLDVPRLDNGAP